MSIVDAYMKAGKFDAASDVGRGDRSQSRFLEKPVDKPAVDAIMAELAAGGKISRRIARADFSRKVLSRRYQMAIKANPRWGEPHFRMAQMQSNPAQRIAELKNAATLDPRNVSYWQTLAEAQTGANLYADAQKSWTAAMKAAPTEPERARLRQARIDLDEKRAEWEESEKKRIAEEAGSRICSASKMRRPRKFIKPKRASINSRASSNRIKSLCHGGTVLPAKKCRAS